MTLSRVEPLRFARGRHAYIVARAYDGDGYIGLRDGRIIARGGERATVTRILIATSQLQNEPAAIKLTAPLKVL